MFKARENPFRSERVERIPFVPVGWTLLELEQRLERSDHRGAIIGPEGSGKTTLLDELDRRYRAKGHEVVRLTFRAGESVLPIGVHAAGQVLLVDGVEQLSESAWQRLSRSAASASAFIITSHRAGFLPTVVECRTSRELLREILPTLIDATALAALGTLPEDRFAARGGNIRLVLRDLYDHAAGL